MTFGPEGLVEIPRRKDYKKIVFPKPILSIITASIPFCYFMILGMMRLVKKRRSRPILDIDVFAIIVFLVFCTGVYFEKYDHDSI